MDIKITDSMLREFLKTDATASKIAECVSLCGPSIERVTKVGKETVYHVEVTTNRVDAASAYGVAREAATILPEFGIKATLLDKTNTDVIKEKKKLSIQIDIDKALCERFTAVLLTDVKIAESPNSIKDQLSAVGQRPINNAIDITNYAMCMYGIPMHAFDADLVGEKIVVRLAKKGEPFETLDDKKHKAIGNEIVFDNGQGTIIDLPGIMGAKNTAVHGGTKNILLVSEHMDPLKVRAASLEHETRTMAATLNEKDPDPNEISTALQYAVGLFEEYTHAKVSSALFDWYPVPRKSKKIEVSHAQIEKILGIEIGKTEISRILESLGFKTAWKADTAHIEIPSSRAKDVDIPEDIAEEVARIYGYFRLPSVIPTGKIPEESRNDIFSFEKKIKTLLKGWGGLEVYTLSMVPKEVAEEKAFRIKNPLGADGEYMRTQLIPSLVKAAKDNTQEKNAFHLFEIANVYLKDKKGAPIEQSTLSGVFAHTEYRHAKGIVEALFEELHITEPVALSKSGPYFMYEFPVNWLQAHSSAFGSFTPIAVYPSQVEDITIVMQKSTKAADVITAIKDSSEMVTQVELHDIYEDAYTFRIHYQHPEKTLTNQEVEEIRESLLQVLKKELKLSIK